MQKKIIIGIIIIIVVGFLINSVMLEKNKKVVLEPRYWPMLYGNNQHYFKPDFTPDLDSIDYLLTPKSFVKNLFPDLFLQFNEVFNALSDEDYVYVQESYRIKKFNRQRDIMWTYSSGPDMLPSNGAGMVLVGDKIITLRYNSRQQLGTIIAIDKDTGNVSWSLDIENWPKNPGRSNDVVFSAKGDIVFVGVDSYKGKNNFFALNSVNGKVLWKQQLPGNFLTNAAPLIFDEKIYTVVQLEDQLSVIYILESNTGKILRTISLTGNFSNSGIIKENQLFIISDIIQEPEPHSILFNVDLMYDKIVWQASIAPTFSYTMIDDVIFLESYNEVFAYDTVTQTVKWTLNEDQRSQFQLIAFHNQIVAASFDGYVYVINLPDGKVKFSKRVQTRWQKFIDFRPSILYMIPGKTGVLAFLDTGDFVYIN